MDDRFNEFPHTEKRVAFHPEDAARKAGAKSESEHGVLGKAKVMARTAMGKAREVAEEVRCRIRDARGAIRGEHAHRAR
ncbi:MAG TPA: hypothetical protein VL172_11640 [Kofleriaceae bacterium]|nr:hypothetical protein [Kofleriaceae bacterium]